MLLEDELAGLPLKCHIVKIVVVCGFSRPHPSHQDVGGEIEASCIGAKGLTGFGATQEGCEVEN